MVLLIPLENNYADYSGKILIVAKNTIGMITRFIQPQGDKHFSFQMVVAEYKDLPRDGEFLLAMSDPVVKEVRPYLQGHSANWAMVEMWTKDEDAAKKAALKLAEYFKSDLLYGDFTRKELGLE